MDRLPDEELESPEPGDEEREAQPTDASQELAAPESPPEPQPPGKPEAAPHRPSFEEAVGEMRQSLREEETKEKTGFGSGVKRFVQRIFRRKTAPLPEVTEARLDEFAIPESPHAAEAATPAQTAPETPEAEEAPTVPPEPEQPSTEADTFHKLVRNKMTGALPGLDKIEPTVAPQETASEGAALDFLAPGQTHLIEQPEAPAQPQSILQSVRGEEATESQDVSSIRQAALEDYVVAPAEEDVTEAAPLPRRLRRGWRDMRPIDRTLLTGALVLLGVVFLGLTGYTVYPLVFPPPTLPPVTPTTSVTPIPISLSLPGGWVFPLRTGRVDQNGIWDPVDAEWLQGTEVCRWVALPWTVQLEAVLRTLKADDPLQLSMSNYDAITYKVRSIQQVPPNQIQQLANDTPCLLVILSKQDSATRWVVTAKP